MNLRKISYELTIARKKLAFQNVEKENRASELVIANKELVFQGIEKENRAVELTIVKNELAIQKEESAKRAIALFISNSFKSGERKRDEEHIGHLAAIVKSSDDAIISNSLNGIINSWNIGSEKMFGYTAKEAIGKHISLIIPADYINEEKEIITKIRNNEIIDNYETLRSRKSGERFYASVTVSPLKNRVGTIIGISKIVRDITFRKKSEAALVLANKELIFQNREKEKHAAELIIANKELIFQNDEKEKRAAELIIANKELVFQSEEREKRSEELRIANSDLIIIKKQLMETNKELEAFSYSVSHDLRAPLRAIAGFSAILKEDYESKLDMEANRVVDTIIENAQMMNELIDNLLSFSKMAGLEAVNDSIDMNALVRKCEAEIMHIERPHQYNIRIHKIPFCNGDAAMLKQVWFNLISNAVKYSSKKECPLIEVGSIKDQSSNIYFVKDNGAGFEMKYSNKLFGVFQRLHRQDQFEGTGLGLALAKRIVNKHGGEIWAKSKLNEGATFFFSIPKILKNGQGIS